MKVIINQFFGLGDIIYCIGIARHLADQGCKVYWPVLPQYLEGLRRAYPHGIEWSNVDLWDGVNWEIKHSHDFRGHTVLPLRFADQILGYSYNNCMAAKYDLFDISNKDWRQHSKFERDLKREQKLMDLLPEARVDKPFTLANRNFSCSLNVNRSKTPAADVYMRAIDGFSLFDWFGVMEMAEEIHSVSTSIIYILEAMDVRANLHLYPRPGDPDFKQIDYLLTPEKWTLHRGYR